MNKPRSSLGVLIGVVLVLIGATYFVSGLGWFDFNVWQLVSRYWPVLLILSGLYLIVRSPAVTLILALLLAGVIFVVEQKYVPAERRFGGKSAAVSGEKREVSMGYDSNATKRAEITLKMGAANIKLDDLLQGSELLKGTATTASPLDIKSSDDGDVRKVYIEANDRGGFWFGNFRRELELNLTPRIPLKLRLDSGASNVNIDASNLQLEDISIDAGASNTTLTLGDKVANAKGSVDTGAGNLTLRIPKSVGLKIHADVGLSSNNFETEGLTKQGETYTTEGFDRNEKKIELTLDGGVSSLKLQRF